MKLAPGLASLVLGPVALFLAPPALPGAESLAGSAPRSVAFFEEYLEEVEDDDDDTPVNVEQRLKSRLSFRLSGTEIPRLPPGNAIAIVDTDEGVRFEGFLSDDEDYQTRRRTARIPFYRFIDGKVRKAATLRLKWDKVGGLFVQLSGKHYLLVADDLIGAQQDDTVTDSTGFRIDFRFFTATSSFRVPWEAEIETEQHAAVPFILNKIVATQR